MMIKAVRNGWPYMERWERFLLIVLFPFWGIVWCVMWLYYSRRRLIGLLTRRGVA